MAAAFAALGALLGITYAVSPSADLQHLCIAVLGVGSGIAMIVGPMLHRPRSRTPWILFAASAWSFLIGALLRPLVDPARHVEQLAANAITAGGYMSMMIGLFLLLRSRGRFERHALPDGFLVCLGAGLAVTVVFVRPSLAAGTGSLAAGFAGLYPFFDVVVLLLLLNIAFTTDLHLPTFRAMALGLVCVFAGDLGYGWIGRSGHVLGSPLLDLPFALSYACFGYMALHPSMVQLTQVTAGRRVQAWSPSRMLFILGAVSVPILVLVTDAGGQVGRLTATGILGLMILTILGRALSAVRDLARAQRASQHLATHDRLTGLPNRLQFLKRIEVAQAGRRRGDPPMWLILLGLDGLNVINDSWGHETGDQVVREVARRLGTVAELGGSVALVGPDVFGALLNAERVELDRVLLRIRDQLATQIELPGVELVVTGSLGIARSDARSPGESLLRNADTAMYRARAEGRGGTVVFDVSMRERVRSRLELEHDLRRALERSELWVAFQPIVDLGTETLAGAETLLRWAHPQRGNVPPNDFIPLAEESGLITDIGAWVMRESVRQLGSWRAAGVVPEDFFLSVNASTHQLRDDALLQLATDALAEHGVPAGSLVVEITESVMMHDGDDGAGSIAVLERFRAAGIRLSVDDFGTGYSSLGYLSRFPVTGVKVDRAFVSALNGEAQDEAIVRAITAMAQALDLAVVAEGVETEFQRDVLRVLGADYGQGWLWGRAVAGDDFRDAHLAVPVGDKAVGDEAQAGVGNSQAQ